MDERAKSQSKVYFSKAEFESDRMKMWHAGWSIKQRRIAPGKLPLSALLMGGSLAIVFVLLPILWLLNKTQPEELTVIDYVRTKG